MFVLFLLFCYVSILFLHFSLLSDSQTLNHIIFFPWCLTAVLRDVKVKESPLEMVKCPDSDGKRMALYPNLDYRGLYSAIVQLVDIVHLIQCGVQGIIHFTFFVKYCRL